MRYLASPVSPGFTERNVRNAMKMIAPLLLYLSLISRHHQVLRDSHRNDIEDTTEVNEATIYENRTEENVAQFTVTDKDFSTEKYQESSKADDSSSFEKLWE